MIYRSHRIGKNGKEFVLYKLRTMKENGGTPTASINDPRLTKIGKWLRRWKLDELPTLWNLIKGDIVIFGCRPDTPEEIVSLDNYTRNIVLTRKPGIISPATIWNYREDSILADKKDAHAYYTKVIKPVKYQLNVWYTLFKTPWLDFKILLAYIFRRVISPKRFKIFPKDFNV
jgi:lipopolysaccharide/colanic/teichoic acid biosynthesis glycosyltransferase